MSKKIGIVSEGVSDYRTLQHITERILKTKIVDGEEYYTIRLNPKEVKINNKDFVHGKECSPIFQDKIIML